MLGKKVIYQIYPKSFYDSNNDGIGDLRGIIEKIDYLKSLNIDMIWFNPFFVSPQKDNGYDIADYYQIDKRFGTMKDFEELVLKLKENNIGVMLDMVFNHCSTENIWFKKALSGDKKYQKYFYLRKGKNNGLPNNWQSKFGGSAWEKFGDTDLYYLHLYAPEQADLDWHNPKVRKEASKIVNFWMQKGVTGFRFDVINVIGKDTELNDAKDLESEKFEYTDTPIVHQYLKELNKNSFGKDNNIITVGEMSSTSIENSIEYSNPKSHELSMVFTFHHLKVDYKKGDKWSREPFDFMQLKEIISKWQLSMDNGDGWNALFWNNHDQPWALSRFGDLGKYREKSAQMLATSMHLLRGTPYIYMGEEIGMFNADYNSIEEYKDIESLNAYRELIKKVSKKEALEIIKTKSRDNSRVPMHWDSSIYAGFSKSKPWLKPTNQKISNVSDELKKGAIFNYYQKLISLRKKEPLIYLGHFKPILEKNRSVFAYVRYLDDESEKLLVLNNYFKEKTKVEIPLEFRKEGTVLISNYPQNLTKLKEFYELRPYESIAFKITQ